MNELLNPLPFIINEDNGKKKILQSRLVKFLEVNGFNQVFLDGESSYIREENRIIRKISIIEIVSFLREILEKEEHAEAYDVFAQSMTSYIGRAKLLLLKTVAPANDKDVRDLSKIFFQNCYCEITAETIIVKEYNALDFTIWENRINTRSYTESNEKSAGQFEQFCLNITGHDTERFRALRSFMGYLLHRNKERGENRAVILYDEMMGVGDRANGRTGKTMLGTAIENCRELIYYDGKTTNFSGNFIYQRIKHSTDIVYYDDLPKNINFEKFYSFLTTGIQVEKKYQQAFYIDGKDAPKLLISSNHYVKGDGGSSDLARRYEFEIINYYDKDFMPEHEFGNRFFGNYWSNIEWNKFYKFMMECVQTYLTYGLVEAEPINLGKNKIKDSTSKEFLEFAVVYFTADEKLDKRELLETFKEYFPLWKDLSSHQFTKWCKTYARYSGLSYRDQPSGGDYYCWFNSKNEGNE